MAEASSTAVSSSPCHLGGITRLEFAPDGQTIFTGGSDCLVRIHKANEPDSEPGFHDNHEDAVTSLTCEGNTLITASLDNIARTFSYPQNEYTGYVTRSASVPIRWVSLDKKGERVAVCSDDLLVKVVHVNDTTRVSLLSDNTKSIRSATWDPTGRYLTTVGCDGKIKVYDMSESTPLLLKIIEGVVASSESDSNISCYAAWSPSGSGFAVPTRTNEIAIINKDWTRQATISPEGPKSMVGELAWSPNGRYLAASSGSLITIFTMDTRQVIAKYTNPSGAITGLSFSPIQNLLAFTSSSGQFSQWTDPIPSTLPSPIVSEAVQAKTLDKLLDDEFGDEDGLDIEERGEDIDDWIVDDDGYAYLEEGKGRGGVVIPTKAQAAFGPGSTGMKSKKRYLAFNMIGVVDVTDQETHQVINVEFHDKSARRGYHFQDHHKYTMAALGEQGIVYACPSDSDEPSQIYYRPYDSWASQSDWTIHLPAGEDAIVVAAGGEIGDGPGSVVVATNKGYVRFFSASGIQRYLWRVEEVVSMVAGKEGLLVIHREGGTSLDGSQNLRYSVIDLESFDLVQEGIVPLPKKALLSWIGFSRDGVPAMYDSTGLLSILDRHRRPSQARWVPFHDSSSVNDKSYWPVGLTETHFTCVILRGKEREPWFPRPLIQEIELGIPLVGMEHEQGKREEAAIRGSISLSQLRDSQADEHTIKQREISLDKELLQLVQGACKADNLQRALDLTRLMHNPGSVDAAAKIAGFYHLPGLQERIGGVVVKKKKVEYHLPRYGNGNGNGNGEREKAKGFNDFAPRSNRRSFGGKVRDRDSTPANGGGNGTYIPETPRTELESTPLEDSVMGSPEGKRKRDEEEFEPVKKVESSFKEPAKNPFAKKPPASNPFAKPALPSGTKALEAIKSTSFFERVDNIESSGTGAGVKTTRHPKRKESGGGKQQTLFPMKSKSKDSENQEVEVEVDETMIETPTEEMDVEVESEELQEAQAPSIVGDSLEREASPEWDETQDDVEL